MGDEYPRILFQTEVDAFREFMDFVDVRFERLGREQGFTVAKLNEIHRLALRLSRLMLRSRAYRYMARQYLRHLRGLALLQSRQYFLMNV